MNIVIPSVMIGVCLTLIFTFVEREQKRSKNSNSVRLPKVFQITSLVLVISLIAFIIVFLVLDLFSGPGGIGGLLFFIFFLLISVLLMIAAFRWRIELEDEGFFYHPTFGRPRYHLYSETEIRRQSFTALKILAGGKRYAIDSNAIGLEEFKNRIEPNNAYPVQTEYR